MFFSTMYKNKLQKRLTYATMHAQKQITEEIDLCYHAMQACHHFLEPYKLAMTHPISRLQPGSFSKIV